MRGGLTLEEERLAYHKQLGLFIQIVARFYTTTGPPSKVCKLFSIEISASSNGIYRKVRFTIICVYDQHE